LWRLLFFTLVPHDPALIDGDITPGELMLVDGELAAVLASLDADTREPKFKRCWHLEVGIGPR